MRKTELIRFLRSGSGLKEMALSAGKSITTMRYWLKKYGLRSTCLPGPKSKLRGKCLTLSADRPKYLCKFCGETDENKMMIKNKKARHHTVCKKCHGAYVTERGRETKKKAIAYKGGKCQKCGYNRCDAALEFHHRDPSQKDEKFFLTKKRKLEDITKELDKCDLLCSNCHKEEHYGLNDN